MLLGGALCGVPLRMEQASHLNPLHHCNTSKRMEHCDGGLLLPSQAWVLLGSAMYAVPLRAERVFYLDTNLPQGQAAEALGLGARVSRVKRTTPAGDSPPLLYQAGDFT